MNVGELLANYEGQVDFFDKSTEKLVCTSYGGSPIISLLQSFEVLEWTAAKSVSKPKITVLCQFTQVPEPSEETEPVVETVEGE